MKKLTLIFSWTILPFELLKMTLSNKFHLSVAFIFSAFIAVGQKANSWNVSEPVFEKGKPGNFDEVSVKDPTIVFFEDAWHLFYTARSKNEYTTGYVAAKKLNELKSAQRYELNQIRGNTRYGCAPQVFYFEPQKKWYLIFQTKDANYQPAFSTTSTISDPGSWTTPKNLIEKDSKRKWIDFWIIADANKVYLFYTEGHNGVMMRSATTQNFPEGWGKSKRVFEDIHEAVHIYKVAGKQEFHMIYELNTEGTRSFGFAEATALEGPWEKVTDEYATGEQLKFCENIRPWTEMVSHGEAIRSGFNEKMEYQPFGCRWLIQGIQKAELNKDYPLLPWKLGIINRVETNKDLQK